MRSRSTPSLLDVESGDKVPHVRYSEPPKTHYNSDGHTSYVLNSLEQLKVDLKSPLWSFGPTVPSLGDVLVSGVSL